MKEVNFEYLKVVYNQKLLHSRLGYKLPVQFVKYWIRDQHQEKWIA